MSGSGSVPAEVVAELRAALGDGAVRTDAASPAERRGDASGTSSGTPLVVVLPSTTAQVSAVARIAPAHRIPIVP